MISPGKLAQIRGLCGKVGWKAEFWYRGVFRCAEHEFEVSGCVRCTLPPFLWTFSPPNLVFVHYHPEICVIRKKVYYQKCSTQNFLQKRFYWKFRRMPSSALKVRSKIMTSVKIVKLSFSSWGSRIVSSNRIDSWFCIIWTSWIRISGW